MATKSIDNHIIIQTSDAAIKTNQRFTMSTVQKSLMEFSITDNSGSNKRLAKITSSKNALGQENYYLSLDVSVLGKLSNKLKTVFGSTGVLEILPASASDPEKPISFDLKEKASGAFTVKIKSNDDGKEYTCRIHPNGIELMYDGETEIYIPEPNSEGAPTIIEPSMSTKCFETMLSPDNTIFASNTSLKKSPMYMVGTYLAAIDANEDLPEGSPRVPYQKIQIPGTTYEVFILNFNGQSTYFTHDTSKKDDKAAMYQNGQLTKIDDVLFLNSQDENGTNNDPYIAFESIIGSSTIHKYIDLPYDAKDGMPQETLQALSEFMSFYGKPKKQAESGQTKDLGSFGDFHFVAEISDAKDEDELKTTIKAKTFKASELTEKKQTPPEKPVEVELYPYSPTTNKIVTKKELEKKGYWKKLSQDSSTIIMTLGIAALLISILLGPIGMVIASTLGALAVVGGGILSVNTDKLNDPLFKLETFVIDPLTRKERESENEIEKFWEKEYEGIDAANHFSAELETMTNQEILPPEAAAMQRAFASFYGDTWKDEYDAFVGEEGLERRTQFASGIDEILSMPTQTAHEVREKEERQAQFLSEFFHTPYGEKLPDNQMQALAQEVFGPNGNEKISERLHQLNKSQEDYQKIKDQQASFLESIDETKLHVAKDPTKGILSNPRLSKNQKHTFVERNAMALAHYYVYDENFSATALSEFLKSLPDESKTVLLDAVQKIQKSADTVRDIAELKQAYDKDIEMLQAYNDMVNEVQKEMAFFNTASEDFVTQEMLATELENYLVAGSLAKIDRLDKTMNFSLSPEGESPNSALLSPVVTNIRKALSSETAQQMAAKIEERAKELKLAGFYEEMTAMWEADPANMPKDSGNNEPTSMPIENAIATQTQTRLLAHIKANMPQAMTEETLHSLQLSELMKMLQEKKVPSPAPNSPLAHMLNAYQATQDIEESIKKELSFAKIATQINAKGPNGKPLVQKAAVTAAMAEMEEKYPKLKALKESEKVAIVTIAMAYERRKKIGEVNSTKDRDADNRDEQTRFLEANQEGVDLIAMALDGSLGLIAKNLYMKEGYTAYYANHNRTLPSEIEAKRIIGKHMSYYNKHEYKFIKNLNETQRKRLQEINPKDWISMQSALQDVMEKDVVLDTSDNSQPGKKKLQPHILANGKTIRETHMQAQLKAIEKWRKSHTTTAEKAIADRMEQNVLTSGALTHLLTFDETEKRFLKPDETPSPSHKTSQKYVTMDMDYSFENEEFNDEIKRTAKGYRQDIKARLSKEERTLGMQQTARIYAARRRKLNKDYNKDASQIQVDEDAEDVTDKKELARREKAAQKAMDNVRKYIAKTDLVKTKMNAILQMQNHGQDESSAVKAQKLNELRKELATLDIPLDFITSNTDFEEVKQKVDSAIKENKLKKENAAKMRAKHSAETVKKEEAFKAAQLAAETFANHQAIFNSEFERIMNLPDGLNPQNKLVELTKLKELMKTLGLSTRKLNSKNLDWSAYKKEIDKKLEDSQTKLAKEVKQKEKERLRKKRKLIKSIAAKKLKHNAKLVEKIVAQSIDQNETDTQTVQQLEQVEQLNRQNDAAENE